MVSPFTSFFAQTSSPSTNTAWFGETYKSWKGQFLPKASFVMQIGRDLAVMSVMVKWITRPTGEGQTARSTCLVTRFTFLVMMVPAEMATSPLRMSSTETNPFSVRINVPLA